MPTPAEAYAALRKAGLKHADPDIVGLFDISAPDYVAKAKAAKPEMFGFDARTAPAAEVEAWFADIVGHRRGYGYGWRTKAAAGAFDAMTAPAAEVEARFADIVKSGGNRSPAAHGSR